jgi:type IV pilus assembly protein PilW
MKLKRGFTLVELLISMFIGLILLGISLQVMILAAKSNRIAQQNMHLQENADAARFFLERDIRRAGFYAGLNENSDISGTFPATKFLPECAKNNESFSGMLFPSIFGLNAFPKNFSCIKNHISESDLLVLRYLKPLASISGKAKDRHKLYMRVSGNEGKLFKAKDKNHYKNLLSKNEYKGLYEVKAYIYYLRKTDRFCDGEEVYGLYREYNNSNNFMSAEEIVSGVEQIQFQFLLGEQFKNGDEVELDEWKNISSIKIDMLFKTECPEAQNIPSMLYELADFKLATEEENQFLRMHSTFVVNLRNRKR